MSGRLIYITGFSGSGKTTIASALQQHIPHSIVLDGDVIRKSINVDLGYDEQSKQENIRRNTELMALLYDQGFTVIAAFMGSLGEYRDLVFDRCPDSIRVQLTTPLDVCIARNTKGLYNKSTSNLAGVTARYSPLTSPDLQLDTSVISVDDCVRSILDIHLTS